MADRPSVRTRVIVPVFIILVMLNFLLLTRQLWPILRSEPASAPQPTAQATSPLPTQTPPTQSTAAPDPVLSGNYQDGLRADGLILLSMQTGGYYHLFAYHPLYLPFTQLTAANWDDITPAISPDGSRVAYASNQGGFWDLYLLDLPSNQTRQLTHTPEYDGAPTWSPDGAWLAFEHYTDSNLDIYLLAVNEPDQQPIALTDDPAADYAPDWSPAGREVAFVSTRSGEEEIWLAQLDENRFTNLSNSSRFIQSHPAWSPTGSQLAWTENREGLDAVSVWERNEPESEPVLYDLAVRAPTWSPDGQKFLAQVIGPNDHGLIVYQTDKVISVPLARTPGSINGADWQAGAFVEHLLPRIEQNGATGTAELWSTNLTNFPIAPLGRFDVVPVDDVTAPYALLHDAVDESFNALRAETAYRAAWDFLTSLENAFIPITEPSAPGMEENWLYTGRSFVVNKVLVHAGWMAVVREQSAGQTYWRIYLKARFQDGSQGLPLRQRPWDLEARNNGDPQVYEQGGQYTPIPEGYWIDFTELALRYGWERLPAQVNWRTYYPAARVNQFVMSGGMDWRTAMSEIYPPEILLTATSVPTPLPTPLPTQKKP